MEVYEDQEEAPGDGVGGEGGGVFSFEGWDWEVCEVCLLNSYLGLARIGDCCVGLRQNPTLESSVRPRSLAASHVEN